jgi:alpha-N-arabinofuranosidase
MKFSLSTSSTASSGFRNGGFYGINIKPANYTASFYYKPSTEAHVESGKLKVGFTDSTGQITFGVSTIDVSDAPVGSWSNLALNISVFRAAPSTQNFFFIEFPPGSKGEFEFNLISCFPPTYKDRPNGARIDIAQMFADLTPGFVRFPGGNDLEGHTIPDRFTWNHTVGPLRNRPGRRGTWIGYNTEGFGLIELLTFTEDIGAIPILAVYAGYSLDGSAVPPDQLQPYIDEVIEELDFLTASADDNRMAALRKSLGRSEPFNIKYVEIGNEDNFGWISYIYRWPAYYNALSQRYPNITFIATTDTHINSPPALDDHYYQVPSFFIENFRFYEYVPRTGPKILVGEFSARDPNYLKTNNSLEISPTRYSSVEAAVAESIFRIGFERNSDIIIGNCKAPILQNVNSTQAQPDLILFDADLVIKSISYLAQKMFGNNLGDLVLNATAANRSMTHQSVQKGQEGDGKLGNLYFIATKRTNDNTLIVKLASVDTNDTVVEVEVQGSTTSSAGLAYVLTSGPGIDPSTVYNTIDNPNAVSIVTVPVSATNGTFSITVPSWSVVVVTLPL